MRSRTTEWFEIKVRYDKVQEDGSNKKETELYVVDALTFTEAEESIIEEMSASISGEFEVKDIKKAAYKEVFFSDMNNDDKWFKVKLKFITIDEKTQKEKFSAVNYLVQANNLPLAVKYVDEVMGKTMFDYQFASITETTIMDVFEHNASAKSQINDKPEYEESQQ